jgi:N-hydroxyarylamine O-acetyltransferase
MAQGGVDLDAYFARLGYAGQPAPTLETLAALHELHPQAIPFENLSPFLGEDIPLDIASLQEKLLTRRRGGWCFEQNLLFAHVLREIGFDLVTLAARVRWNAPAGEARPRSHMLLLVKLPGGEYIADVGFGGLVLTAPLRLASGIEQPTPHEPFRVTSSEGMHLLEAHVAGAWQPLYAFDLHEQTLPDYEVSNWYLAHHPKSQFVTGIIAARTEPGRRHALRGDRYTLHRQGQSSESRSIESVDDFKETLAGPLRIRLPESPELDARLARLLDAHHAAR